MFFKKSFSEKLKTFRKYVFGELKTGEDVDRLEQATKEANIFFWVFWFSYWPVSAFNLPLAYCFLGLALFFLLLEVLGHLYARDCLNDFLLKEKQADLPNTLNIPEYSITGEVPIN